MEVIYWRTIEMQPDVLPVPTKPCLMPIVQSKLNRDR